ncbi:MAG: sulfite exporter TauE/SafE family protein [Myxococcota bacterium]
MSVADVALLVGSGLLAGFINTVAGGGSLLTLPALMLTGLDASVANGTNRVGILFQTGTATHAFLRSGHLPVRAAARLLLPALAGTVLGSWSASVTPDRILEPVLLSVLVGMALLMVARPALLTPPGDEEIPRRARGPGAMLQLVGAGFYAGFVQAGVGFVLLAVLAGGLRYDLVRSNGIKVALVLVLTVANLAIFVAAGQVRWIPGLVLAASAVVGALLGVRLAVRHTGALRWVVLVAVIAAAVAVALR